MLSKPRNRALSHAVAPGEFGECGTLCTAPAGVVRRETDSWKWTAFLFGYMMVLAYLAAFATYNVAVALGAG